ncbi:MAG: hypothetical protein OSB09_00880 [Planctomycetota bacterium]|nr:hypothetical protein [Planctomycetota bacterium]
MEPQGPHRKPRSRAAEAIHRRIRGVVKALLNGTDGDSLAGLPDHIELRLRIPIHLQENDHRDSVQFADSLLAQVETLRIQGETESLGHRTGHAPCYWCQAPVCQHSQPPDSRSILVGWSATGIPIWRELASLFIENGDPQIDLLYGEHPGPAVCWLGEGELLGEILPEYLNDSLFARPVGALLAGGFPIPGQASESLCITALILESRVGRVVPRYSLNLLCAVPAPHHIDTITADHSRSIMSGWIGALRSSLHHFQEQLLVDASKGKRASLKSSRQRIVDLLIESRSQLETLRRRNDRRTKHAQQRSEDPNRPTSAALSDLLDGDESDLFEDRRESTIVLRGPQGRIHIFTSSGRHITSAVYSTDSIQSRIARSRWVPMTKTRAHALIDRVRQSTEPGSPGLSQGHAS